MCRLSLILILLLSVVYVNGNNTTDDRGYIVKVGDYAPDFVIEKTDGSKCKLSDYKGKVVMLQFTASWCSVCRKEMPHIEKEIWTPFKDKGLVLFGVDRGENKEQVIRFAEKMNVTYPLIMDEESDIFTLFADKRSGVTRNVIIDKNGKIVFLTRLFDRNEFNDMIRVIKGLL